MCSSRRSKAGEGAISKPHPKLIQQLKQLANEYTSSIGNGRYPVSFCTKV